MATTYQASALRQAAGDQSQMVTSRRRPRVGALPWIAALALASWTIVAAVAIVAYRISA